MSKVLVTKLEGNLEERGFHAGDTEITFNYTGNGGFKFIYSQIDEIYSKDSMFRIRDVNQQYVTESSHLVDAPFADEQIEVVPEVVGQCTIVINKYYIKRLWFNNVLSCEEMSHLINLTRFDSGSGSVKGVIDLSALDENQKLQSLNDIYGCFKGDLKHLKINNRNVILDFYNSTVHGEISEAIKTSLNGIRIHSVGSVNIGDVSSYNKLGAYSGGTYKFIFIGYNITYTGELLTAMGNSWKNSKKNSRIECRFDNPNGSVTINGNPVPTTAFTVTFASNKVSVPYGSGAYESTDGETWTFVS